MSAIALDVRQRAVVVDGQAFGAAGAYEKIAGTLRFAVDPTHRLHGQITDLERAPRNAAGRVEFQGDFHVLKPVEAARGNRRLLLDVGNRGRKLAIAMFNSAVRVPDPTTTEDFGNGFLMRHGWTVAWIGWQHDVPRQDGMMALDVPRARGVGGLVRCEFRPNLPADALPLADRYHIPNAAAELDDPAARLTVREHGGAPAVAVPRTAWRFTDPGHIRLEGGFVPGRIYDVVYRAVDPPVVGLGFLAVRDTAAFLRWGTAGEGNPCAGALERAYVFGVSQSGRFLRHLLYLGLDETEDGRPAFDAVVPHVAGARRGEFNLRFGQPSLNATESLGSLFPFTDAVATDPVTGQRDGLLARLAARGRAPRIFTLNTSAEYWRGDGSLVHTDVEGARDVEPDAGGRVYFLAGTQHTPGSLPPADADPNTGGRGIHPFNVVDYAPLLRAALVNLDRWVSEGIEPPPSAVPRLADGTAVTPESTRATFAAIPGVRFPDRHARPARLDFGPEIARGVATELPPKAGAQYPSYVSAVDADGNEVAGLRPPELLAPLATYTGWNLRHPDQGAP
ncbi:MAG TPA: alpha/beta hydrolase domain-containing protein, partial [Candidatus Binatia bacterium]|nr:alpha/beta hydrolase domain-containing protein [Candidatus Binatia bacterium]